MKLKHGDPQYLVLYDDQGTPLATCVSIEARDRLIEACNKLAAAEARVDRAIQGWSETQNELTGAKVKLIDAEARAKKAEEDSRRIDWFEAKRWAKDWAGVELQWDGDELVGVTFSYYGPKTPKTLREAIDAARAEGGE